MHHSSLTFSLQLIFPSHYTGIGEREVLHCIIITKVEISVAFRFYTIFEPSTFVLFIVYPLVFVKLSFRKDSVAVLTQSHKNRLEA